MAASASPKEAAPVADTQRPSATEKDDFDDDTKYQPQPAATLHQKIPVRPEGRPGDGVLWLFLVAGIAYIMAACRPGAPWRIHKDKGEFGKRWIWDRTFSLMTVGSQADKPMGWHHMAKRVCERYANLVQVQDVSVLEAAIGKSIRLGHEHPNIGGAFFGCEVWDVCKEHTASRCVNYGAFMSLGLTCAGLLLAAALCGALALLFQANERKHLYLQDLQEAQRRTFMACIFGALLSCIATISWTVRSAELFLSLQETGYYPTPPLATAFWQAASGSSLLLLCSCIAAFREYATWQERLTMYRELKRKGKKAAKQAIEREERARKTREGQASEAPEAEVT